MDYSVIYPFKDRLDDKKYQIGDKYTGSKAKARIDELTTSNNAIKTPLIKIAKVEKKEKVKNDRTAKA